MSQAPIRVRITADDLGWSEEVNEGIARALRAGTLSAVSVLATGPAFEHGVALLREVLAERRPHAEVSVGLHLDLTDFGCVAGPAAIPSLVDERGGFRRGSRALMAALLAGTARAEHAARELEAQLARLGAAGFTVGHLDGHRHAHLFPGLARRVAAAARELRFVRTMPSADPRPIAPAALPERLALAALSARLARALGPRRRGASSAAVAGLAEGHPLEADWIARTVRAARPGLTEIVTHPGLASSGSVGRTHGHDRSLDLAALTSPALAEALASPGVELVRPS